MIYQLKASRENFNTIRITSSVQFSHSVVSSSLRPHGLQHARLPCPSLTPRACSNSFHQVSDAIQPSHPLLSPSPPAFNLPPASGHFPASQFFASCGWSFGVSASVSVLPMTGLISLLCESLLQHHSFKASILLCSVFFMVQLSHPYMTAGKIIALTPWTFVSKASPETDSNPDSVTYKMFVLQLNFWQTICLLLSFFACLSLFFLIDKIDILCSHYINLLVQCLVQYLHNW